MNRLICALLLCISITAKAADTSICTTLNGASIIAQDDKNTFLGRIINPYDMNSIFNEYGDSGSIYGMNSIWNKYSLFGSEFGVHSPFNKHSSMPPMIIKNQQVIGFLSTNKAIANAVSPNLLKALCKDGI